jgi:hypothetical protein
MKCVNYFVHHLQYCIVKTGQQVNTVVITALVLIIWFSHVHHTHRTEQVEPRVLSMLSSHTANYTSRQSVGYQTPINAVRSSHVSPVKESQFFGFKYRWAPATQPLKIAAKYFWSRTQKIQQVQQRAAKDAPQSLDYDITCLCNSHTYLYET